MALEIIAGFAVRLAFGYLKDQKGLQHLLGFADGPTLDAAKSAVDRRVTKFFSERQRNDSPFRNRGLAKALRRAYLESLQFVSAECRRRVEGKFLDADTESWLDALNGAIHYELIQMTKEDYLPPASSSRQTVSHLLRADGFRASESLEQLDRSLVSELQHELSAPDEDSSNQASALAMKLHENLKKLGLTRQIPAQFHQMLAYGWEDEARAFRIRRSNSETHDGRVHWIDLVDNFFANGMSRDPKLSELFFRDVLCSLATDSRSQHPVEFEPFLQQVTERTVELKLYLARFEGVLQKIERRLERDSHFRSEQDAGFDHLKGELTGLFTLLETQHGTVRNMLEGFGVTSAATEHLSHRVDERTERIETRLDALAALLQKQMKEHRRTDDRQLSPELQAAIGRAYLAWLENVLQFVPGGVTVDGRRLELPLDQVYVSLRGYPSSNANIRQGRGARRPTDRYEEPLGLQERDAAAQYAKLLSVSTDLAQAFLKNRTMVILGDPGSGKTTLCRWLALLAVKSIKDGRSRLQAPAKTIDSAAPHPNEVIDLGAAHMPIFMRIADVEEKYGKNTSLTLDDLLGASQSLGRPTYIDGEQAGQSVDEKDMNVFLRGYVGRHEAILFLDGLDELANPRDRKKMVDLIHQFVSDHYREDSDATDRLIVTSRIVGYELHPMRDSVTKFTIERLKPSAVQVFSESWHQAYFLQAAVPDANAVARAACERFLAQVFHPSRVALRELASNPLLLSLLCVVNQEHGQSLPESRAHLYRLIVNRGLHSLFVDRKREHELIEEEIKLTLCAIATRMHTTTSNGILPAREIREITKQFLSATIEHEQADFRFNMVVVGTGLLSERGDLSDQDNKQYGFRHQTIQEYLAGLELVSDPTFAAARLIEHCADPRWREATLLGIGELSERQQISADTFSQICSELLRAKSGIFDIGAILLAQSVRDFTNLPVAIIEQTISKLLNAYSTVEPLHQEAFCSFVEETIAYLLLSNAAKPSWRRAAEKAIARFTDSRSIEKTQILSRLIQRRGLYVEQFVEPLLETCRSDNRATSWSIHVALESMASSRDTTAKRFLVAGLGIVARLKPETLATIKDSKLVESVGYFPASEEFIPASCSLAAFLLPLREFLECNDGLLNVVKRDPHWLAIILPLYGGLGNYNTTLLRQELLEGRSKIGSPLLDDMVKGRIAARLDTFLQSPLETAKKAGTEFRPEVIFRDSPMTPVIMEALLKSESAHSILETAQKLWAQPDGYVAQALAASFRDTAAGRLCDDEASKAIMLCDALIVIASLGKPDDYQAIKNPTCELHRRALSIFHDEVERLRQQQQEILYRAKGAFERFLARCTQEDNQKDPTAFDEPAILVTQTNGDWSEKGWDPLPDGQERIDVLGSRWLEIINLADAQSSHRLAVHLDSCGKDLARYPDELMASWLYLNTDRHSKWPHPRREHTYPQYQADAPAHLIRLYCLAGIDAIPQGFAFLRVFAMMHLPDRIVKDPEWKPLLIGLALPLASRRREFAMALAKLGGDQLNPELLRAAAIREAEAIQDPLLRFWTYRYLTGAHQAAAEEWRRQMLNCALSIDHRNCQSDTLRTFVSLFTGTTEAGEAQSKLRDLNPDAVSKASPLRTPEVNEMDAAIEMAVDLMWRRGSSLLVPLNLISARSRGNRTRLLRLALRYYLTGEADDREYSINVVLDTVGKQLGGSVADLIQALAESLDYAVEEGWDTQKLAINIGETHPHYPLLQALTFLAILPPEAEALTAWALNRMTAYVTANARDLLGMAYLIGAGLREKYRSICLPLELFALTSAEVAEKIADLLNQIEDPWTRFHTTRFLRVCAGDVVDATSELESALLVPAEFGRMKALELTIFENAEDLLLETEATKVLNRLRQSMSAEEFAMLHLIWGLALPVDLRQLIGILGSAGLSAVLNRGQARVAPPRQTHESILWLEERAPLVADAMEAAALASVCLGCRLDLIAPPQEQQVELSSLLNQAYDSPLWRAQLQHALRSGIHMSPKDVEAVLEALKKPDSAIRVEQLLPFVGSYDQQVTTAIQDWAASATGSFIEKWATLLLAEQGQWNTKVVAVLLELLQSPNDLLRNRAWMQLSGARPRSSSRLRLPVLLALAGGRLHSSPQVSLSSAWAFEAVLYDDPGLIRQCVTAVESRSAGYERAEIVLGSMKQPSVRVVGEALELLDATEDDRVRRNLLRGLVFSWAGRMRHYPANHPLLPKARVLIERLRASENAEVMKMAYEALGFFATQEEEQACKERSLVRDRSQAYELHALAIMAEERGGSPWLDLEAEGFFDRLTDTLQGIESDAAIAAGELFLRAGFPPEQIRERTPNDDVFLRACAASLEKHFVDRSFKTRLALLGQTIGSLSARHIDQNGLDSMDLLSSVIGLLKSALERPWMTGLEGLPGDRLANLLPLCAAAAEIMPDLYRKIVEQGDAPSALRLQIASARVKSFPARQAALNLLALTRVFSSAFAQAVITASIDVHQVQRTLLDCVDRFREIDEEAFADLSKLLRKPSANVRYFAARIILAVVANENLPPQRRAECRAMGIRAINEALEAADLFKVVSLIERGEDEWTPRVRDVGLLRDLLQDALVHLSSVDLSERTYDKGDGCAVVRFHAGTPSESRTFDLRIGARPAEDPVSNQQLWLQADFGIQIPADLRNALTDLRSIAADNSVSCAELTDMARRL